MIRAALPRSIACKSSALNRPTARRPGRDIFRRAERIVGPEQDLRRLHQLGERRQRIDRGGARSVVAESLHVMGRPQRQPRLQVLARGEEGVEALHQCRRGAAGVREDPLDVRELGRGAAEQQARDRARGVGAELDDRLGHVRNQVAAAIVAIGMGVDHRLATVELFHDRRERRVAQELALVVGHHADAVHLQRVESICDLAQAAFDVRHRHDSEQAEAARVVRDHLGAEVVALVGERAGGVVVAEEHARLADRQDRGRDAALVHVVDRLCDRPSHQRLLAGAPAGDLRDEAGRGEVMMGVDAERLLGGGRLRAQRPGGGQRAGASAARPPSNVRRLQQAVPEWTWSSHTGARGSSCGVSLMVFSRALSRIPRMTLQPRRR